ncbi:hypothetical protein [Natronobacterium gregoryi]|uniref:Uncharacterized protein n=2 Tax=Natronobacterium gregoryi TaxID=44930 RepID=L0AP43_NATGS|nr:hypothetical protein [Natronobacterium gregoryi]AFZ74870.1 hypothetical protein Natgr_3768 [Natronobacterium gregoryi SP2]ELY73288.1 hypothetical protein C490_01737 [Natronobacterium gregoryi SP2]PLK19323.1 hypothetical protein CYV19_15530 [Natronobacterium gregoryi SP2]SFJ53636.1 hypothetical protein SAMN05443661_13721 [Natronobacterium gregoryi]
MYERNFGTDWETLEDRDHVIRRAFALGVAEQLGSEHPGELERLTEAVDSTYDRSFVEIAYQKGKEKAGAKRPRAERDEDIWEELVEEKTTIDPSETPASTEFDETFGLPRPLRGLDIDAFYVDSTRRIRRPTFLERQAPKPRSKSAQDQTEEDREDDTSSNWWDANVKRDMASETDGNRDAEN